MFNSNIHLNLYSEKAYVVMRLIKYALKTGTPLPRLTGLAMRIERDLTNETVIYVNASSDRYYFIRSKWYRFTNEHEAKDWLANYLKRWLINYLGRSSSVWNRFNYAYAFSSEELRKSFGIDADINVTYSDIYFIYDYLKERKHALKMYSDELIREFKGEARNEIEVELKRARIEEINRLTNERDEKIREVSQWYNNEVETLTNKLQTERDKRQNEIYAEYNKRLDEVNSVNTNVDEMMSLLSA